jgi:hypothetical protein
MNNQEMYEYITKLRDYIVTLEKRISVLEQKVTPPETRDLGNGRRGFTRQGINNMLDGMVGKKIPIPTKEDLRF